MLDGPITWTATVAGPVDSPVFPHAALNIKLITAEEVGSDPAINLLYPGSTSLDGVLFPGDLRSPAVKPELPQDQWANMDFARPAGAAPAEAFKRFLTPGSAYDVAQWYQSRLTAMGWQTTTDTNYGNVLSLAFLNGPHRFFLLSFVTRPFDSAQNGTTFELTLREAAQDAVRVDSGLQLGTPYPPISPCPQPVAPAVITLTGTLSGTSSTLCPVYGDRRPPWCTYWSVGFVVGQTRFIVWGPPYSSNDMTITDPQLRIHAARPVQPAQSTVTGTSLRIVGHFSGQGYDETADISTQCVLPAATG
jgi:hypothetical protein